MTFRGPRRRPFAALFALGLVAASLVGSDPAAVEAAPADATLPSAGAPATMQAGDRWFPRDEQGRAFVLHGHNIKNHGDRLDEITPDRLQAMRDNGFTVLRLATFWVDLEPTEGDWNETYIEDLRRILQDADEVGLRVVLTMHQDSYSEAVGGYGMPDWTTRTDGIAYQPNALPCLEPANQRAWQHFWEDEDLQQAHVRAWEKMVDEFQDEPALYGYDLLNEACGEIQPADGGNFVAALQRVEATQITPMLQRVTDAIRAKDTERWIFLEGAYALTSTLGGDGGLGAVDDPTGRQIFAPHVYDLTMETGGDWNPASAFVTNYYDKIVDYGVENDVPIVVFEWGPRSPQLPNAGDYVRQVLHGADRAVAGWSAFAFCSGLGGWCQLDGDQNPGAGATDTTQTYPMAVAGRPMEIVGDYAAGRSEVQVDPVGAGATGPSTFYFPMRRFPTGPTVRVEPLLQPAAARAASAAAAPLALPSDQWSWSFDEATQTVSVDVDAAAAYRIVVQPAVVSFTKTGAAPVDADGDGAIGAGDTVEFTFTVENLTDGELGAPAVDDPLIPAVVCPTEPIAASATVTCTGTYELTAADAAAGTVTNEATLTLSDGTSAHHAIASTTVTWEPSAPTTTTTDPSTSTAPTSTTVSPSTTAGRGAVGSSGSTGSSGTGRGGTRSGSLARTGSAPQPLIVAGIALVTLGALAVGIGRRRRTV